MKTLNLIIIGTIIFFAGTVKAQTGNNVNAGTSSTWCPTEQNGVRYYYMPDVEAYYNLQSSMFIYREKSGWVEKANLPERFSSYDLNCGYKIMVTGNINFDSHKTKYANVVFLDEEITNSEIQVRNNDIDKLAQIVF